MSTSDAPFETVDSLRASLRSGRTTPAAVLAACFEAIDRRNAELNAFLLVDRSVAPGDASDDRPLAGIPVGVKDNVATSGMPTTVGSRALASSTPPDAPLVTRLRDAGAVIVGKTNLSEWANFRSSHSVDGWSAVGGQTRNPHDPTRTTSGSSSGSAAAVAAGMVPLAVGTETDGSILSPAGMCGIVGFKPSLGAVPGGGIVPISPEQDVAGPMARTVRDAALLYSVLSGTPLAEPPTSTPRLALWTPDGVSPGAGDVLRSCVDRLHWEVTPVSVDAGALGDPEYAALIVEFRAAIDDYLASAPDAAVRSLRELVEFNEADPVELSVFGQEIFEKAVVARPLSDPSYLEQRRTVTAQARDLLDEALTGVDAILTLTNEPAHLIGGSYADWSTTNPPAIAGYPAITIPAGWVDGLPVGVTLISRRDTDQSLLSLAAAAESQMTAS